ncbi:YadA-like family protein [Dialister micraerophilus]|uniref:YadA-like family protein n=1 Tax=Dialister micraerophilus TaxID=309120 RepID=UPI00254FC8C6|nr:YadA-like family protein [Dialister micraerophilus]MDK8285937.1 YadA-like family protein [Dialister micraerophilus]
MGTNWLNDGAKALGGIAIGPRTGAKGEYGTAVGSYAQADGVQASAFGVAANASGTAATAAGTNAVAGGASAAAFGSQAKAEGTASSAFGLLAQAKSNESVAVGAYTVAEKHAAAIGPQAKALSEQSVAVGGKSEAQAAYSLAVGSLASATQKGGVALGANSLADRQAGVWGFDASTGQAMNEDTLLGEKKAERAQEIDKLNGLRGELQQLRTEFAESVKNDPVGPDGKRIPSDKTKQIQENLKNKTDEFNAQFKLVNGYVNAWQSIDGAVSVGNAEVGVTRQITGVAAGTEDTDVVNVAQLKAAVKDVNTEAAKHTTVAAGQNITVDEGTNDNGGKAYTVKLNDTLTGLKSVETEKITVGGKVTIDKDGLKTGDVTIKEDGIHAGDKVITGVADGVNATDAVNMRQFGVLDNQVKTNTTNISLLNGRVDMLDNRVNRVGAGAAALAGLHPMDYDPENKWDFAAGYGNYNGANAIAIGAFYRPDENKMISIGGSFGGGENMVSAGISVKLGQGTGISTSKAAMANEIRELKARDREREAQMQEIMRQLEILRRQAGK